MATPADPGAPAAAGTPAGHAWPGTRAPPMTKEGPTVPTTPRPGPPAPSGSGVDPAIMAARYGGARRGRPGRIAVAGLVVLLIALVAILAAGLGRPTATAEHVGYTVQGDDAVSVRFNVITDPGTTVTCRVVAVNDSFAQVGFREVTLGPAPSRMTSHETEVRTTERASAAHVDGCSVVDG
ncbi:DUF4307 domain-containing protein [Georgenia sp. TF02-10]|uniref:DUF4307 domain-containing protein n=1 Tax=Georgenia sp. TF02-10 TaxID=2917725 RepID=UPI001FA75E6D|nr:DUF4307 domain-containing protein [Georgenia sp. TF02-10]UNX55619.1 DUF4307 domain-containing protein [Georgenia sp. TF02-10]